MAAFYLEKLRLEIGNQKMDEILSSQGDSTLMFAIDTTGSMRDEIHAAKAIAKQIINATRDFKVDYILSPFNDPRKSKFTPPVSLMASTISDQYLLKIFFSLNSYGKYISSILILTYILDAYCTKLILTFI